MRQFMFAVAMIAFVTGCAGPMNGVDGAASVKDAGLEGTWRGVFEQVQTGDSGRIHGGIVCEINGDGTYKMTWTTELVAGSTRGGGVVISGTVAENGNLVSFDEPASGIRTTLRRSGDTLYGVRTDPGTKRVSVSVEMHKVIPESP